MREGDGEPQVKRGKIHMGNQKLISFKCPEAFLEGLNELVRAKIYPSRSEAIRVAIRDLLKKELWEAESVFESLRVPKIVEPPAIKGITNGRSKEVTTSVVDVILRFQQILRDTLDSFDVDLVWDSDFIKPPPLA